MLVIDIETLSTSAKAVVLSIGVAVSTDDFAKLPKGQLATHTPGVPIHGIQWNLDVQGQIDRGRIIDASTLEWWHGQTSATYEAARSKPYHPGPVLEELWNVVEAMGPDCEIWARGSMDQHVLESLLSDYCRKNPWTYRQWNDERTIEKFFGRDAYETSGGGHKAADDAIATYANIMNAKAHLNELTAARLHLEGVKHGA